LPREEQLQICYKRLGYQNYSTDLYKLFAIALELNLHFCVIIWFADKNETIVFFVPFRNYFIRNHGSLILVKLRKWFNNWVKQYHAINTDATNLGK